MPKNPKRPSEQSRRFMERAEEIGASASEGEFQRFFRRVVPEKKPPEEEASGVAARGETVPKKRSPAIRRALLREASHFLKSDTDDASSRARRFSYLA